MNTFLIRSISFLLTCSLAGCNSSDAPYKSSVGDTQESMTPHLDKKESVLSDAPDKVFAHNAYYIPIENCVGTLPSPIGIRVLEASSDTNVSLSASCNDAEHVKQFVCEYVSAIKVGNEKLYSQMMSNKANINGEFPLMNNLFSLSESVTILHQYNISKNMYLVILSTNSDDFPIFPICVRKGTSGAFNRYVEFESMPLFDVLVALFSANNLEEAERSHFAITNISKLKWKALDIEDSVSEIEIGGICLIMRS